MSTSIHARTHSLAASLSLRAGAVAALLLIGGQAFAQQPAVPSGVTASSVLVLNADTGQILYEKNPDKAYRILSLTKLITAHVLVERMGDRLSETVTVTQAQLVPGSTAGLRKGDVWSLENLLYGAILVSGNDASLAIADHAGAAILAEEGKKGSPRPRFVKAMGTAAASLGAKRSKFADPYGISASNVSTARDIAIIGSSIFRDERLLPFWECAQRTVKVGGPQARTVTLDSTIKILGEEGVLGGKTGSHVGKNIYHLVAGWRAPNGATIVAVVLGSASHPARYGDMRAILAALPIDFPDLAEAATGSTEDAAAAACR